MEESERLDLKMTTTMPNLTGNIYNLNLNHLTNLESWGSKPSNSGDAQFGIEIQSKPIPSILQILEKLRLSLLQPSSGRLCSLPSLPASPPPILEPAMSPALPQPRKLGKNYSVYVCIYKLIQREFMWFTFDLNDPTGIDDAIMHRISSNTSTNNSSIRIPKRLFPIARLGEEVIGDIGWAVCQGKLYRTSLVRRGARGNFRVNEVACVDLLARHNNLSVTGTGPCPPSPWQLCSPPQYTRRPPHTWELDGKIYLLGGCSKADNERWAEVYDPKLDTWQVLPDLNRPEYIRYCQLFSATLHCPAKSLIVGSRIDGDIHMFDVSENKWYNISTGNHLPETCIGQIAAVGSFLFWYSAKDDCVFAYHYINQTLFRSGRILHVLSVDPHRVVHPGASLRLCHVAGNKFYFMFLDPNHVSYPEPDYIYVQPVGSGSPPSDSENIHPNTGHDYPHRGE